MAVTYRTILVPSLRGAAAGARPLQPAAAGAFARSQNPKKETSGWPHRRGSEKGVQQEQQQQQQQQQPFPSPVSVGGQALSPVRPDLLLWEELTF